VQVNIKNLIDDAQCYQTVRELRWPDGVRCPSCESPHVIKRGFDDTEPARQRYECHDCNKRFDDLTDTIFAGHHQPLKVWIFEFIPIKSWAAKGSDAPGSCAGHN
jgi:transposase-like protein